MLRITIVEDHSSATLKLEGRLVSDWIAETRGAWDTVRSNGNERLVTIDLIGVLFVDDDGRELLVQMRRAGACLVGSGPMMVGLIEDIEREHRPKKRSSLAKMLMLLVAIA